jgi:hypothetical protein
VSYVVKMELGTMLQLPSFIKFGSGIQKLIGGIHIQTHTNKPEGDFINLLYFFKIREVE